MLDGSNLSRLATLKFRESFGCELIESALSGIALDLPIPRLPVVLHEPIAERCELLGSKLFNFALKSFNFGHVVQKFTISSPLPITKRPHAEALQALNFGSATCTDSERPSASCQRLERRSAWFTAECVNARGRNDIRCVIITAPRIRRISKRGVHVCRPTHVLTA